MKLFSRLTHLLALSVFVFTMLGAVSIAFADVSGVWRTESNDDGAYLEVTVDACASDASKICGTITRAMTTGGEDAEYENLGKLIIMDMRDDGNGKYSHGKIWDPEHDKTFKSNMTLKGEELDVDGCISFICEGQHWQRVQ